MRVICIDNIQSDGCTVKLTPGKIYDVYDYESNNWAVTNDSGTVRWYHNDVLMPLDEWRDNQLKELGI